MQRPKVLFQGRLLHVGSDPPCLQRGEEGGGPSRQLYQLYIIARPGDDVSAWS